MVQLSSRRNLAAIQLPLPHQTVPLSINLSTKTVRLSVQYETRPLRNAAIVESSDTQLFTRIYGHETGKLIDGEFVVRPDQLRKS